MWLMLAGVLGWLAGVAFLVAIGLAFFRRTRTLGVGCIIGAVIAGVVGIIVFALLYLIAVAANPATQ